MSLGSASICLEEDRSKPKNPNQRPIVPAVSVATRADRALPVAVSFHVALKNGAEDILIDQQSA